MALGFLALSACTQPLPRPGTQTRQPELLQDIFLAADGTALPFRSWIPAGSRLSAVIIALHGFNDYSNSFASAGEFFSRHAIACYAYDQRGFGRSPVRGTWAGTAVYANDLAQFSGAVRGRHPGVPLYLLGDSMGGAVAMVAATGSSPPDIDGVILVAPAVWGRSTMPWYQSWLLTVTAHTVPWMEVTGKGLDIKPSDNRDMLRALGRDPLVIKSTRIGTISGLVDLMDQALERADRLTLPTLVQYGRNDQIVPKEPTLLMLGKMPPTARRAFYDNGYHLLLRDLQGEKPLTDIVSWIGDRDRPLAYGKDAW